MNYLIASELMAVLLVIGCWKAASNPKLSKPERMAGYTYAVYFALLGGTIFLSGIRLTLGAKSSSVAAAILFAIGLFGKKHSRDSFLDTELAAFENIFATNLIILGLALGLTSTVIWALFLLKGQ